MAQFTIDSWRQCALWGLVALLAACSDESAAPTSAANVAAQPSTPPSAETTAAPQNATVAELLAGSDQQQPTNSQQPAAPSPSSPAQVSTNEGIGVTAAGAAESTDVEYARVVSVTPLTGPRQVCTNETVTEQRKPDDQHQVAGTVIGAIAGGVIGNQFGGGRGKTLATVGGAVGGGVVGKEVQRKHQANETVTHVVKRCRMVDQPAGAAPVYDVVYAYQGENIRVRLDHDPGDRLALPIRGIVNE